MPDRMDAAPTSPLADLLSHVPPRIQFEARRKAVHVTGAVVAVVAFILLPFLASVTLALLIVLVITVAHLVRRRRIKVAPPIEMLTDPIGEALELTRRPGEDFPWAPVSFVLGLTLIGSTTELAGLDKAFAVAAFGILGMGDAASALIGIAWGRHKLPWNRRKSWEGSAAGLVASFLSAVLLASVAFSVRGVVFPVEWLAVALAGALAGTLVETVPRLQDNFFVPLAALAAMLAAARVLALA